MTRPVVLLDCDGPLADLVASTRPIVHRLLSRHAPHLLPWRPAPHWDFDRGLPAEVRDGVQRAWREVGFCSELQVVDGATDWVLLLRQRADVYVVTSPMSDSATWMSERLRWLRDRFGFGREHVIFAHDKQLIHGDVLVDDKPENLATWHDRRRVSHALLWRTFYNLDERRWLAADTWGTMGPLILERL